MSKPSGAQNRKRKKHEAEFISTLPRLDNFFRPAAADFPGPSASLPFRTADSASQIAREIFWPVGNVGADSGVASGIEDTFELELSETQPEEMEDALQQLSLNQYPTDKALFQESPLTAETKRNIIAQGPCQPPILDKYYSSCHKGIKIQRHWLCFSPTLKQAYCQTCWMFGGETEWSSGITLKKKDGLVKKIELHEKSAGHRQCHKDFLLFKDQAIDLAIDKQLEGEREKWSLIIERVISVVMSAASMNLPLRGHEETVGDGVCKGGNFLELVRLLAEYDDLLRQVIATEKGKTKYLSPKIQNEIVDLVSTKTSDQIVEDILRAPFFAIILDSTADISKTDQLSLVVRYVVFQETSFKIEESFLAFVSMKSSSAKSVAKAAIDKLKSLGLTISKLRAQGYDGASVMSGIYNGVQALIKNQLSTPAPFVHCSAHNLNLVLQDCVTSILHVKDFFDCLGQIYTFIGSSYLRWQEVMGGDGLALKRLCPTRWTSRLESVRAIKMRQPQILKFLTKLTLTADRATAATAEGLASRIRTYEFTVTLILWEQILTKTYRVTNCLQSKAVDLSVVSDSLSSLTNFLERLETNYEGILEAARVQAEYAGADKNFRLAIRRSLYCYSGRARGQNLEEMSKEQIFKTSVFLPSIRACKKQTLLRFEGHSQVIDQFSCITPKQLVKEDINRLKENAGKLRKLYERDLSECFVNELIDLRHDFGEELGQLSSPNELLDFVLKKQLGTLYPEVVTALALFLTIPVTVASAERSFSKLKLIKNYLRSTMSQERLSGLAIISIENSTARKLDRKELVRAFALTKPKRAKKFGF